MIEYLLLLIAFPASFVGALLFEGIDRKVHARLQKRIGPPIIQPFYDIIKLMQKERIIPVTASRWLFTAAPVIAAAMSALVASIVVTNAIIITIGGDQVVGGDLLLVIYLIAMVSVMMMVGGLASGNPYAVIGFGRKMTLLIAYKVPIVLSFVSLAFNPVFSLIMNEAMSLQISNGVVLALSSPSKAIATVAFLLCLPAAAETVPFDIADAKSEIMSGILIEYGGPLLALMKLAKSFLVFSLVLLGTMLFMYVPASLDFTFLEQAGNEGLTLLVTVAISWAVLLVTSLVVLLLAITMPRTILARVKIGQAFKYFMVLPLSLALLSIVLSLLNV